MVGSVFAEVDAGTGIARVFLDNPQKRNALTRAMWSELGTVFGALDRDASVRLVVLAGTGGHFCAGADVSEFREHRSGANAAEFDRDTEHSLATVRQCRVPVVAAISGFCLGGGVSLAVACDVRVVIGDAKFSIPAARLGTAYPVEALSRLASRVGTARTAWMVMGGERLDARRALEWGLVEEIFPDDEAANEFLGLWALNAPLTLEVTKLSLRSLQEETGVLADSIAKVFESDDYHEGVRAFEERRPPRFQGR